MIQQGLVTQEIESIINLQPIITPALRNAKSSFENLASPSKLKKKQPSISFAQMKKSGISNSVAF